MEPTGVHNRTAVTLVLLTQITPKPQAHCHSHRLVIKLQATRGNVEGKQPISTSDKQTQYKSEKVNNLK